MNMSVEERLAYLEGAYAQIAARLESIDRQIEHLKDRIVAAQERFANEVTALQTETSRRLYNIEDVVRRQS